MAAQVAVIASLLVRLLFAGLVVAHAASAHAEPDPPRPQMVVSFEIEAEKFARNLPEKGAASAELAQLIASEFALRYPFAQWSNGVAVATEPPIGRLAARLVQKPTGGIPSIWVKWYGSAGEGQLVELPIQQVEIYSSGVVDRETNNKARFVARVASLVLPTVQSDGFQQQFMNVVVQRLPIASAAEMRSADRVVIVHRMWRDLRFGRETTLALVFRRPVGNAFEEGTLKLVLPSSRASDPKAGWLQAGVQDASIGTNSLRLNDGWHERFQTLLEGAVVRCFIKDYHLQAFTDTLESVSLSSK